MICSRLDSELMQLAKAQRSNYTRYADDITFSTSKSSFPRDLAYLDDLDQLHLGTGLSDILQSNGFELNEKKLRLQHRGERQEVTGLVVNKLSNVPRTHIRQIRAMLHAWEKYGETAAEVEYHANYDHRQRWPGASRPSFRLVVQGKLEFVRMVKPKGSRDPVYRRYRSKLLALAPELAREDDAPGLIPLVVFTEGKTDIKHIRAALKRLQDQGDFGELELEFHTEENIDGSSQLLAYCQNASKRDPSERIVCIFDRDEPSFIKKVTGRNADFKKWRDDVYSLALPVPPHRTLEPNISIELLYTDANLTTADINGRRIFLSTEFSQTSGRLVADPSINTTSGAFKSPFKKVIDGGVYNEKDENLALTKDAFADHVEKAEPGFDGFDINGFRPLFELLAVLAQP
jgi:RNA-directed DNA polymerase